jgi:RimJ/RimL family protein N-acetyltransferase
MTMPPVLETARLVLRELRLADFPAFAVMQADPQLMRYVSGGKPVAREGAWRQFAMLSGFWTLLGYGWWTVVEKATGAYVGHVGFSDFHRGITGFDAPFEVGWMVMPGMAGRGYATEAARSALDWGAASFPDARFTCLIHADHAASIRVAEKCGFDKIGEAIYRDSPVILFRRQGASGK